MPPPPVRFTHIGLWATDLDVMQDFYTRIFNFVVSDRGLLDVGSGQKIELCFLTRDPTVHHQIVFLKGRPNDVNFNVINQISLLAESLSDLRAYHEVLVKEPKVSNIMPLTHGNAWSVYFDDPEGNRIELYADTPWYVTQPFRGPLDFTLSDDEIVHRTEALVHTYPSAAPVEDWQARIATALGMRDWPKQG